MASAYTDVGKDHPLDACKEVWDKDMLTRYDCGGQGDYKLIAHTSEETGLYPAIQTPTGVYQLNIWDHGINTYYGYHGKPLSREEMGRALEELGWK